MRGEGEGRDLRIRNAHGETVPPLGGGDFVLGYDSHRRIVATFGRHDVGIRIENLQLDGAEPVWCVDPEAGVSLTYEMLDKLTNNTRYPTAPPSEPKDGGTP